MTTIANYNVSLTMDANKYVDGSRLSRKETASLTRAINSTRTPAEKYERNLSLLDKALAKGAISQSTYTNLLNKQKDALDRVSVKTKRATAVFTKLAGAVAAVGFGRIIRDASKLAMETEQVAVKFRVLTGSAESAEDVLNRIRTFAASTPFRFEELSGAASGLLAFGSSTGEVVKELRMLGDISSGVGMPIGELASLYGKARIQQTLFSEDINQFTGRGIDVITEFANQLGVASSQVKGLAADGKISFANLQTALETMVSKGGDFNGMTEELSETTGGKLSTAMDKLQTSMIEMGEKFEPVILALVEGFEEGDSVIQVVVASVEELADALAMTVTFSRDLYRNFTGAQAGFASLSKELDRQDARDTRRFVAETFAEEFGAEEKKKRAALEATEKQQAKLAAERKAIFEDIAAERKKDHERAIMREKAAKSFQDHLAKIREKADKEATKAAEAQLKLGKTALDNAKKHFAEERKRAEQRRKDIVGLMGSAGAEASSSEAVKFLAQQQNARLAQAELLPAEPSEKQLLDQTKKQLVILNKQAAIAERQEVQLERLIQTMEETKVRRIR